MAYSTSSLNAWRWAANVLDATYTYAPGSLTNQATKVREVVGSRDGYDAGDFATESKRRQFIVWIDAAATGGVIEPTAVHIDGVLTVGGTAYRIVQIIERRPDGNQVHVETIEQ